MGVIKRLLRNYKGLTLVEVLAVIVILGILVGIALPVYMGRVEKAEKDVCEANKLEVKRHYKTGLSLDGVNSSDLLFMEFMRNNNEMGCPVGGVYRYLEEEVLCEIHGNEEDDDNTDEVPWL